MMHESYCLLHTGYTRWQVAFVQATEKAPVHVHQRDPAKGEASPLGQVTYPVLQIVTRELPKHQALHCLVLAETTGKIPAEFKPKGLSKHVR